MRGPAQPKNSRSGRRRRSASTRPAAYRSPDASPAEIRTFGPTRIKSSARGRWGAARFFSARSNSLQKGVRRGARFLIRFGGARLHPSRASELPTWTTTARATLAVRITKNAVVFRVMAKAATRYGESPTPEFRFEACGPIGLAPRGSCSGRRAGHRRGTAFGSGCIARPGWPRKLRLFPENQPVAERQHRCDGHEESHPAHHGAHADGQQNIGEIQRIADVPVRPVGHQRRRLHFGRVHHVRLAGTTRPRCG